MSAELESKQGPARYSMASNALVFRRVMRGDVAQVGYNDKIEAVFEVNRACALAAAALTTQPLPLVDFALLVPIQVRMVQAIGKLHGKPMDKGSVRALFDKYGLGIGAQLSLISASKLLPGFGSLAAPSVAYAMTLAIGELADHFVQHGHAVLPRPLTAAWLLDANARKAFLKLFRAKSGELRAAAQSGDDLATKLEQLRVAYTKDLMSEQEYAQLKADVMRTFSSRA